MENKELFGSRHEGNRVIEIFVDIGSLDKIVSDTTQPTGTTTFYERTTIIEEKVRDRYFDFTPDVMKIIMSEEKIKTPPKPKKLSKVPTQLQRIFRSQYADRKAFNFTTDYFLTFERWCLEQYNVDSSK